MQTARLLTSEITWCMRCSLRYCRRNVPKLLIRHQQHRLLSSDAIPAAVCEGEDKKYPAKIQQLVQDISQLTLIEVADLNELLKKTLKIADAPVMAMSMPASQRSQEEEEAPEVKQEKVAFTVRIIKFDDTKKVALIKEVKNLISGMNLVQAKKFVESLPNTVRADVPKEEAEKLKESLTAVGATVEIE